MNILLDLFLTFAKVGVCTFGGGLAMLPILQREVCDQKHWVTEENLVDYYAIGQCTPGIIAINTATFVGTAQAGTWGGIIATIGMVFPSIVIIMLIAAFLQNFADLPLVIHAFNGVRACVCALIFSNILKLRKTTVADRTSLCIFLVVMLLATLGGFVTFPNTAVGSALSLLTSPVTLVLLAGAAGLIFHILDFKQNGGKTAL